MIYKEPPVPLRAGPGANKLFENNSLIGLKLVFAQPAIVRLFGAGCVILPIAIGINFVNFVQNLNFKFLSSYSSVLQTPL
jgi:hypothetical protein